MGRIGLLAGLVVLGTVSTTALVAQSLQGEDVPRGRELHAEAGQAEQSAGQLPRVLPVRVTNLPDPQNVVGTVEVANLPVDSEGALRVSCTADDESGFLVLEVPTNGEGYGPEGWTSSVFASGGWKQISAIAHLFNPSTGALFNEYVIQVEFRNVTGELFPSGIAFGSDNRVDIIGAEARVIMGTGTVLKTV